MKLTQHDNTVKATGSFDVDDNADTRLAARKLYNQYVKATIGQDRPVWDELDETLQARWNELAQRDGMTWQDALKEINS